MAVSPNTSPTDAAPGPDRAAPLIIVGTARSGSSLLTLMLNRGADAFIVNDAYVAQLAEGMSADRVPSGAKLAAFRDACLARLDARSVAAGPAPIHRSAILDAAARARAGGAEGEGWAALWADMACRAAGERRLWGWNTPPDFARTGELLQAFPGARFLFLLRDPYAVLRSYKNLPAYWGREARRYHPALQAFAWRRAALSYESLARRAPERVGLVRYETLVADPAGALRRIGAWLGVETGAVDPAEIMGNGSALAQELTRAEVAVARRVLGAVPARFGYSPVEGAPGGAAEILRLTLRAGGYYAREAARSPDMRGRIRRLVRV